VNAPLEPAHSRFGGSVAARVLNCPASVCLIEKVPAHLRKPPSAYATRGTALHIAAAMVIERICTLEETIGKVLNDYTITRDDVENYLRPVIAYVDTLLDQLGEYYLEVRVRFPGAADAFGTCDLLVRIGTTVYVLDFKFGCGLRVLALTPDGDEDIVNSQLMFYLTAALHTVPDFFNGATRFVIVILQPQTVDPESELASEAVVTRAFVEEFTTAFHDACKKALSPNPPLKKGKHCQFCAGKTICPLFTGPHIGVRETRSGAEAAARHLLRAG
jgi:Protein of unknown function (DUF2800)